jgi:hypothetical protein
MVYLNPSADYVEHMVKQLLVRFPLDESVSKGELVEELSESRQKVAAREAELATVKRSSRQRGPRIHSWSPTWPRTI